MTALQTPPRLSNLGHLDFLRASVTPPPTLGHSAYGSKPRGVLWTQADRHADGSYKRFGGGTYDLMTNTYGQGSYNAADIARAAVVYLWHWTQFHEPASLEAARGLSRGPWTQPDDTPNPGADPVEPRPTDCWL